MPVKNSLLLQFPQLHIVEASAGSGKTYALAKRYIQLLIEQSLASDEIPLNSILAITFTNKASIEMKERILELLKKIALDKFKDADERRYILSNLAVCDEALLRARAHRIMDALIKNYNFFQVQTIDSFINAILSGCAFRLNLSANFRIKTDYEDYLAYSLDAFIERASSEKEVLEIFKGFLWQYLHIENRTGWFPKKDILLIMNKLFSETNKYGAGFVRNEIGTQDVFACKKNILKLMRRLKEILPEGTNGNFARYFGIFLEENKDNFDMDDVSTTFRNEAFPINKNAALPDEAAKLWQKIRKKLGKLCELESSFIYNYYIDIFNSLLDNLNALSNKEDLLFLEALNKQARSLFDEETAILPELYYRLATRFRHFLIDEFQDTSALQWKNLLIMVEDALASNGSLFYVGDRKQAIYRFRGGEASLIDMAKERFTTVKPILSSLNKNYRSQKEVVEFNNRLFSQENLRRFLAQREDARKGTIELSDEDVAEITGVFAGSYQIYKDENNAGYVRLEHISGKTKDEQEDVLKMKLPALVEELRKRFSYKDIAILTRKNDDVELLTSWLLQKDIPVESEKTLNIRANSYIKELVSFLKFLDSPIDNLSFASFILGDMFTEASGLSREDVESFIFKCRRKKKEARPAYLYREFRREFPKIWDDLLEEFFRNVGFVPLYELVISILGRFDIMRRFKEYQGFFMRFLELIKEEEEERPSISAFLEFFDEAKDEKLYVKSSDSDSVKILTIHKAKGLEFGVVVVPFFEINIKTSSAVSDDSESALRLIHIKRRYGYFSEHLARIYREEYKKAFIDELNNIYVALTRAKYEMYAFIPEKAERGPNLARELLTDDTLEYGKRIEYKLPDKTKRIPAIDIPPSNYKDWIGLLKDEFVDASLLRSRDKVKRGEVLHYALSFIGNIYKEDAGPLIKKAIDATRARFPYLRDLKDIEDTINRLFSDKTLKRYFEVPEGEVYQEKDIVSSFGDAKRIDRLIVTKKEVVVLDYKSAHDEKLSGGYHKQVAEYMKVVKDIYKTAQVRGVLVYLDDLSAEEVEWNGR